MKFIVIGTVDPERAGIRIGPTEEGIVDVGGSIKLSCEASRVTIIIKDVPTVTDHFSAFELAFDVAAAWVESLGFALGTSYSVNLVQVITEEDTSHVFGVRPGGLHFGDDPDNLDETSGQLFHQAKNLSFQDIRFRYAMGDFVRALDETRLCSHYCYRAVEAICSAFGSGDNEKSDWKLMHTALGTNKDEIISVLKDSADLTRHGNWTKAKPPTLEQRRKMLILARDILAKYVDYQKRVGSEK